MEYIPNIYTMVPYFDRAQISKLDIFRYFFRPITDTPIADTPIADTK
jgi:hypothetical protein